MLLRQAASVRGPGCTLRARSRGWREGGEAAGDKGEGEGVARTNAGPEAAGLPPGCPPAPRVPGKVRDPRKPVPVRHLRRPGQEGGCQPFPPSLQPAPRRPRERSGAGYAWPGPRRRVRCAGWECRQRGRTLLPWAPSSAPPWPGLGDPNPRCGEARGAGPATPPALPGALGGPPHRGRCGVPPPPPSPPHSGAGWGGREGGVRGGGLARDGEGSPGEDGGRDSDSERGGGWGRQDGGSRRWEAGVAGGSGSAEEERGAVGRVPSRPVHPSSVAGSAGPLWPARASRAPHPGGACTHLLGARTRAGQQQRRRAWRAQSRAASSGRPSRPQPPPPPPPP